MRAFVALTTACLLMALCGCGLCGNDIVQEVISPDGQKKAVIFQRDCGATTAFSTQISVLPRQDSPSGSGNIFVADADHGAVPVGPKGVMDIRVRWESDRKLVIAHPLQARVFLKEANWGLVSIRYELQDPPGEARK